MARFKCNSFFEPVEGATVFLPFYTPCALDSWLTDFKNATAG